MVEVQLNERIRGEVKIGSIEWPTSALTKIVTGGWIEITVHDLEVYDEPGGELVLKTDLATAELDAHAAIFGRHDLILRDIKIVDGGYAKVKQIAEPYPAHEFDYYTVSLIAAFYPKREPSFRAGVQARPGVVIDLQGYEIAGVTMEFEIRDLFYAIAYGIHGTGNLRMDASDPLAKKLYYSLTPRAPLGLIKFKGGGTEVLTDIDVKRLALVPAAFPKEMFPRDLEYEATAIGTDGARIHIDGAMLDHWVDFFGGEHKTRVEIDRAKLSSKLIAAEILGPGSSSSLAAERIGIDLTGPVLAPRVSVEVTDVDYVQQMPENLPASVSREARAPLELKLASAKLSFDLATEAGILENTVARGMDGEVKLEASFTLRPLAFHAKLDIAEPLELRAYLPRRVRDVAGTRLSGQLEAIGTPQIQRLERLDLRLGRAHLVGKAYRTQSGTIAAEGLRASIDRTSARNIRGFINTADETIDVRFDLSSNDLGSLLTRLGYARLADGVNGFVHVGGPLDDLRVHGKLGFRGVPVVDNLQADLSYRRELLRIDSARSTTLGGTLLARGALDFSGVPRVKELTISGEKLELSRIPGYGDRLGGTASVRAEVGGPLAAPDADLELAIAGLTVAGDPYKDTVIRASTAAGGFTLGANLERVRGGRLAVDARVGAGGGLGGDIALDSLPLGDILELAGLDSNLVGGTVSSRIDLSGTAAEPTGDGVIRATKSWIAEAFLGSTDISIKRIDSGVMQISGRLLQGRIGIDGTVSTVAPFETDLEVRFRRIEADHFFPELAERYGARAWVSGQLSYRADLSPASKRRPQASARLTEVEVRVDREDDQGRPAPLRVRTAKPVELSYDGARLSLHTPAIFEGPGGSLTITGSMDDKGVDLGIKGTIALSLLERYTQNQFDAIAGKVMIDATAVGALPIPRVDGTLQLKGVAVKPAGQDTFVTIPEGVLRVNNDLIAATGFSVVVVDEYSDDSSTLDISGAVKLEDFKPAVWTVIIDGELAGKMLLVAASETFSSASGKAALNLTLSGTGLYPDVSGAIEFSPKDSLTFTPRGLRREIRMTGGLLAFDESEIRFDAVTGWIDDEGQFTIGPPGRDDERSVLNHESLRPSSLDLTVNARNLPFRVPQVLTLSVNLDKVRVVGDFSEDLPLGDQLSIAGAVEIVDGRYIQNWTNLLQNQFKPQRTSESAPPVWERVPLLGNARLNLDVASPGFAVQNNIANINLNGEVAVTGTPLRPKIQGIIDVEQGSFKIPGFRANFSRTTGSVTFSRVRDFPTTTPNLDITSESTYRDLRGQDHLVKLRLTGPLENISWDLSTASGLNRAQTLTLIVFGRTPADARRLFGDEAIGRREPGDIDSGSASTVDSDSTLAAVDRLAKDLVGDQFNLLIGDKLRDLTKLDVLRVEVGTASWGLRAEKELTESLRLLGDAAWSARGISGVFSLENRFNDTLSIDFNGLAKRFNDEALDDENDVTLRFSWRKVLLP